MMLIYRVVLYSLQRLGFVNDVPALISHEEFMPSVKQDNLETFDMISLRNTATSDRTARSSQAPNAELLNVPPFKSKMENGIECH